MSFFTGSGTKISLGTKTPAKTKAEYEADTYVQIGEVGNRGAFGDTSSPVTWTSLDDGRTRKAKGTRDAGDMTVGVAYDKGDLGQQAAIAAEADNSPLDYNLKVEFANGDPDATPPIANTVVYMPVKVMSFQFQDADTSGVVQAQLSMAINGKPLIV